MGFILRLRGIISALLLISIATHAQVLGIDFGSEYYKVSLVTNETYLEIVENEYGDRISPSDVAFSPEGRRFGKAAVNYADKDPLMSFGYVRRIIG
jgi:molecular chaperone DnaK (HSP70)